MTSPDPGTEPRRPSLLQLFGAFLRIALSAFGGGTQALVFRSIVEGRRWLSEREFIAGYALAQVLPGSNPLNVALYVGMRLRGSLGAAVAACGLILPDFCIILALGYFYRAFGGVALVHVLLGGVAAIGIAATLAVGVKFAARLPKLRHWIIAAATFATVGLVHWPLLAVVAVAVPASILLSYFFDPRYGRRE